MKEYTLYLDESEIPINEKCDDDVLFVIGGIAVEDVYHDKVLTNKLNLLKNNLWCEEKFESKRKNFILHELEVTYAKFGNFKKMKHKYHRVFANPSKYKLLYKELTELSNSSDFTVISACIKQKELYSLYNRFALNDRMSILMQAIIENFYHFLVENNSFGKICYEAMPENQNDIILKRYKYIQNTGTMFYPARMINKRISDLSFCDKNKNITGLQIADFVPNTLGRVECDKYSYSNDYYNSIYRKIYDGNRKLKEKFGFKVIP